MDAHPESTSDETASTTTSLPDEPDAVWEVLTSPDGVEAWMGEGSHLPAEEGAELDVADVETGVRRRGIVRTVEPRRRLSFDWWPASGEEPGDGASRVDIVLHPSGDGTHLVVTETPLRPSGPMSAHASLTTGSTWCWRTGALELELASRIRRAGLVVTC